MFVCPNVSPKSIHNLHQYYEKKQNLDHTPCTPFFKTNKLHAHTPSQVHSLHIRTCLTHNRWVFFPPEDVGCLYPVLAAHSTDLAFEVDLAHPDLTAHPLLALSHPRECMLQPGELLFVPAGCPHRVENLEKSLAISANFVDRSNYERVLGELEVNALVDERAGELLSEMSSRSFITDVDMDQEDLVWGEYKK